MGTAVEGLGGEPGEVDGGGDGEGGEAVSGEQEATGEVVVGGTGAEEEGEEDGVPRRTAVLISNLMSIRNLMDFPKEEEEEGSGEGMQCKCQRPSPAFKPTRQWSRKGRRAPDWTLPQCRS